ncbi:hypothetical protein Hanom_Chr11g00988831 [Helianthus anomalus]
MGRIMLHMNVNMRVRISVCFAIVVVGGFSFEKGGTWFYLRSNVCGFTKIAFWLCACHVTNRFFLLDDKSSLELAKFCKKGL